MGEIVGNISSIIDHLRAMANANFSCLPNEEKDVPDTVRALAYILKNKPAEAILAFGYTHRELPEQRSAVKAFSEQMIPLLARRGYKNLVLEVFPKGKPGSLIEKEIAAFNRNGKIGNEMLRFVEVDDRQNFIQLFKKAHSHGIRIHAGGVNYESVFETIWYPNFSSDPKRMKRTNEEIRRNSGEAIRSLAARGKKVFSLNGCIHNDLYPPARHTSASFGPELNRHFPKRVVEIDMVIPELSKRNEYYKDLPLSQSCDWRKFIPAAGMKVLSEKGPNSYLLLWH